MRHKANPISLNRCISGISIGTKITASHIGPDIIIWNTARFSGSIAVSYIRLNCTYRDRHDIRLWSWRYYGNLHAQNPEGVEWSVLVVTYLAIRINTSGNKVSFFNNIFSFCRTSFYAHPLKMNLLEYMQPYLGSIEAWPSDILVCLFCCPPTKSRLRGVARVFYRNDVPLTIDSAFFYTCKDAWSSFDIETLNDWYSYWQKLIVVPG